MRVQVHAYLDVRLPMVGKQSTKPSATDNWSLLWVETQSSETISYHTKMHTYHYIVYMRQRRQQQHIPLTGIDHLQSKRHSLSDWFKQTILYALCIIIRPLYYSIADNVYAGNFRGTIFSSCPQLFVAIILSLTSLMWPILLFVYAGCMHYSKTFVYSLTSNHKNLGRCTVHLILPHLMILETAVHKAQDHSEKKSIIVTGNLHAH